ncbi:MAG: hypothetical protein MZV63_35780 [Marinilabiliales bacterium]|nr:hypothetical protein [Marinilabiliales bacterium]
MTVQASLNYPHTSDISFDYAATGGTATSGVDYILAPGTVTIPAGSVTGSFNITVINDALVEPSETIIAGLTNPSAGVSIGTQNSYTYTILNDDIVYASFSSATASGPEGNAAAPVTTLQIVVSGGIIKRSRKPFGFGYKRYGNLRRLDADQQSYHHSGRKLYGPCVNTHTCLGANHRW